MQSLVFATNNKHKVEEIRSVLNDQFNIITLKEAGIDIDIPEPFDTIEENAAIKSQTIYNMLTLDCFSEDTGLEVNALGGEPGVRSARYAGDNSDSEANITKLLSKLDNITDRTARFKTIIYLIYHHKEYVFEGICSGSITHVPKGSSGFGYDSVFVPDGSTKTFAEMSMTEKNMFSHRKKAVVKLINFFKDNEQN